MLAVTVNSVGVSRSITCPDTRQGMIIEPSKPSDGDARLGTCSLLLMFVSEYIVHSCSTCDMDARERASCS